MTPATPANTNSIDPNPISALNPSAALFFAVVVGANTNVDVLVAGRAAGVVAGGPVTRVMVVTPAIAPVPVLVGPAGVRGVLVTGGDIAVVVGIEGVVKSPGTGRALMVVL
jgi:hypothetical protein